MEEENGAVVITISENVEHEVSRSVIRKASKYLHLADQLILPGGNSLLTRKRRGDATPILF